MEQEEDGGGAACGLCRETGRCADLKYITAVPASAGLLMAQTIVLCIAGVEK